MIAGECWQTHDDDALRRIDAMAVRLLSQSGACIHHDGLLSMLEGAGCKVNRSAQRAYIPERLVRDAIARVGGKSSSTVQFKSGWNPCCWPS